MIIRKLRLDHGWSQEQLAEISGVSTRTIQRIERGKQASLESLKCLAAVFETEISHLQKDTEMTNQTISEDDKATLNKMKEWMAQMEAGNHAVPHVDEQEREAVEYVRDIKSFYSNLASYVGVMILLLIINLLTNPGYLWVIWPALGWGFGIAMHALSVFEVFSPLGVNWERKQIQKRLRHK